MVELRSFMIKRPRGSGDRSNYLDLQFEQAMDGLPLKGYSAFKKICTKQERAEYEPGILKQLEKVWGTEKLKIHIFRKEYERALTLLTKAGYPYRIFGGSEILKVASQLEHLHPDEILSF